MKSNKISIKRPTAKRIEKAADAIAPRRKGAGKAHAKGKSRQQVENAVPEPLEPVGDVRTLLPDIVAVPASSGPPNDIAGPRVRTRTEIRQRCAAVFDGVITDIFQEHLRRVRASAFLTIKDEKTGKVLELPLDTKLVSGVQSIASLYAQVGVGYIGVNQVDPQEIPNLPPPVFNVLDPNAELPEGAPE